MKTRITTTILTTALAVLVSVGGVWASTPLDGELNQLDHELDLAGKYIADHQQRIVTIENLLHSRGVSLEQQFRIYEQLYDEYRAYQFDKAMQMLDCQSELARAMKDRSRGTDVDIRRAMLYTTSGMFFEAALLLNNTIDTLSLNQNQLVEYYNTCQRFHLDFHEYTQTPEMNRLSSGKVRYYRNCILDRTDPDSELHRFMVVRNAIDDGDYATADSLNRLLLSCAEPSSHRYANLAYYQAVISEAMARPEEQRLWYIRSATADIRSAIKDNASLCSLAQLLLQDRDVDRAFRYISFSLNDALFYNAKLRPWQIASVMPLIENAYQQTRAEKERAQRNQITVVSILSVVLTLICAYIFYQYRRSRKVSREMERMNRQIEEYNTSLYDTNRRLEMLNDALREANTVKEEYIGLFLSLCSDYIDKLSAWRKNVRRKLAAGKSAELQEELASQEAVKAEVSSFYDMFDNAFLTLYPDFVEAFNGLLRPECRIELKKGERLNTELRIFALIRLGITDSSRIASLLRYSVNTIYNYRARIKNNAAGNRDNLEEELKSIDITAAYVGSKR